MARRRWATCKLFGGFLNIIYRFRQALKRSSHLSFFFCSSKLQCYQIRNHTIFLSLYDGPHRYKKPHDFVGESDDNIFRD